MNLPIKSAPSAVGHRADWLPDEGVWLYVRDILQQDFNIEVDHLPDHWIPLAIVGTLDWVYVCGWWIMRNTGIFNSDEPNKWVFDFNGYEFDPSKLLMFRDDPTRNKFEDRLRDPGINGKERTEALQFLFRDVFEVWWRHEREKTPKQAEEFFPPQEFIEVTMYASFLWILDTYGRDWIYMQDEVYACTFDYGVAYLSKWTNPMELLDPEVMKCTDRKKNTCRYCGEGLVCVSGTNVDSNWQYTCNHCLVNLVMGGEHELEEFDARIRSPECPHWKGVDGEVGTCISTCPHSGNTADKVWEKLEEWGTGRVEKYREHVRELGMSPRQAAGQRLEDIVGHFEKARHGSSDVRRRTLPGEDRTRRIPEREE